MGNVKSSDEISHDPLQDSDRDDQRRMFAEFYDDLEEQFGLDISSAFTTPFSDLPDAYSVSDPDQRVSLCEAALHLEPRFAELRYRLVPNRISEQHFWTHFLIKIEDFRSRYDDIAPEKDQHRLASEKISQKSDSNQPKLVTASALPNRFPVHAPPKTSSPSLTSAPTASPITASAPSDPVAAALPNMEVCLLSIPEVFIYQIPPRRDAQGHYARSWGLDQPLWSGALRVISSENHVVFLRLYDPNSGQVFADSDTINLAAICKQSEPSRSARLKAIQNYVEPTLDTSRYFVVRFKNSVSGQIAFLGIGFRHRSSAFDLNASILDQLSKCERYLNLDVKTGKRISLRNSFMKEHDQNQDKLASDFLGAKPHTFIPSNEYQLPSLPGSDQDAVPPALSPPKPQRLLRETDDEDDDVFGAFLAAAQHPNKV